ncbi:CBS domain-containing protein [Pseudenhygromyxa sp. WMMC2535]|uniref:CBS domain-containing protein n=1 Tax=Pseudenhygromyxa sp. WMMC2535 TaxID=2712867 RepID=UPI00155216A7|nr:CBS domain-containing protein [Pseudenhygromyxa sp. WMMC2535]NVB41132.1 CBS domain-containing protein [Pseudenhygromyxa sp. WMMC2535]
MSVEAIMTKEVLSVSPETTVREAVRLLEDSDVRHLPVVEGGCELVGIVSDRDLREYRIPVMLEIERLDEEDRARADRILDTPVSEAMNTDIVAVDSSESIDSVIAAMIEYRVGAVPVVDRDSDELVGIVSYIDVLRYAREILEEGDE